MKSGDTHRLWLWLFGLFTVALVTRIIFLMEMVDNPFFHYPIVDAYNYHKIASNFVMGNELYPGPFFQPPLYPLFLGIIYSMFGISITWARLAQSILGIINVFLTYRLALTLFNRRMGLAAGFCMAVYGTMIFFESELLSPVLIVFLNLLFVYVLDGFLKRPSVIRALVCGVILGMSAITMVVVLPFAAVVVIYSAWKFRRDGKITDWKYPVVRGLVFAAGILIVITPVTVRNYLQGDTVFVSYNGGINFYLGTGADYEQKVAIRPGEEWIKLVGEPDREGYLRPKQRSDFFYKKGLEIIRDDPLSYIRLLGYKFFLFSNGNEIMRNQAIYPYRGYSKLMSVLVWKKFIAFPYGVLFPLALLGMSLVAIKRGKRSYPMVLFILSHLLVILLFFVSARYRMNIIPFLIIMAVYGAGCTYRMFLEKKWKAAGICTVALLLAAVFCNWNVGRMPVEFNADAYCSLGRFQMLDGKRDAKKWLQKAIALKPDYPLAQISLGVVLDLEGKHKEAMMLFDKVLEKDPLDLHANINKGYALYSLGDHDRARQYFNKVLELYPDNEKARDGIRAVLSKTRDKDTD